MAASIWDWSVIAANNSNSDADMTWAEGQAPSTVNNSARVVVQRVKQFLVDLGGSISAGGTANGLTVTAASPFAAYTDGLIVAFRATANNTGAATLNVNGVGSKAIRKMGTTADIALDAGDLVNTGIYIAMYSALLNGAVGAWLLINATRAGKAPTVQTFTATGLWTNPGARVAIFEGVGGGGGGGGCTGALSNWASTGGGGSGFYGKTGFVDVSATASATVTIGAAGAGGAAGNNEGGTGGDTAITIGAATYTWPGGDGSPGATANVGEHVVTLPGGFAVLGTNVKGSSNQGGRGWNSATDTDAFSGEGASTPFGVGGAHAVITTTGGSAGNSAAANTGAGGGGAVSGNQAINRAGGAGGSGYMMVWEFY